MPFRKHYCVLVDFEIELPRGIEKELVRYKKGKIISIRPNWRYTKVMLDNGWIAPLERT